MNQIITPTGKLSKQCDKLIADLLGEKFSMYGPERQETYTNRAMRHGQDTEEEARRFYCMERNVEVTNGGFCMSDDGRWGCSPDFLVGEIGAGELKCPFNPGVHAGYLLAGNVIPSDYRIQCEGHLVVTGRDFVDFMSYACGMPPLLVRLEPNPLTEKLRSALDQFYDRFAAALKRFAAIQGEAS